MSTSVKFFAGNNTLNLATKIAENLHICNEFVGHLNIETCKSLFKTLRKYSKNDEEWLRAIKNY